MTRVLVARDLNNGDLRRRLELDGYRVSQQYVQFLVDGQRRPSLEMLDRIGRLLDLTDEWIVLLHRAAALDHGYRIGSVE